MPRLTTLDQPLSRSGALPRLGRSRTGQLFACILAAGFVLRLGPMLAWPSAQRPDEVFQALEPAHRLLTGFGVVSWEWREGIRSWLLPGFLAAIMSVARHAGLGTGGVLAAVASVLAGASLVPVVLIWRAGWAEAGLAGALCAAAALALWPDLVYLGPRTLTEVQGGHLLILAAALAARPFPARREASLCAATGALLGLCFALRFHFAPALALVASWRCRWRLASWAALAGGMAGPLLLSGGLDWITLGTPFQSVWKNFVVNIVQNRSEAFGVSPPWWYLQAFGALWGAAAVPVAVCFVVGARRQPLFASLAAAVLLSHSAVAHKEISFVYPAVLAALFVAGVGSVALCRRLACLSRRPANTVMLAGAATWVALAGGVAVRERESWSPWPGMWAESTVRKQAELCGLGLFGVNWGRSGGYTYLDRPVPVSLIAGPDELALAVPGLDTVIAPEDLDVPGFARTVCRDGTCVWHVPRPCQGPVAFDINTELVRRGQ